MSQIPTLVVAPSIEARLGKQLLVEPLPARTLEEGLVWDAEGGAGEGVPESGVLMVSVKSSLDFSVSEVQLQYLGD